MSSSIIVVCQELKCNTRLIGFAPFNNFPSYFFAEITTIIVKFVHVSKRSNPIEKRPQRPRKFHNELAKSRAMPGVVICISYFIFFVLLVPAGYSIRPMITSYGTCGISDDLISYPSSSSSTSGLVDQRAVHESRAIHEHLIDTPTSVFSKLNKV